MCRRGDLLHPAPGSFADLAARASSRFSIALALDSLDAPTLTVAAACCALEVDGEGFTAEAVVGFLRDRSDAAGTGWTSGTQAIVSDALDVLAARALVWGSAGDPPHEDDLLHAAAALADAMGSASSELLLAAPELERHRLVAASSAQVQALEAAAGQRLMDSVREVEELLVELGRRPAAIVRSGGIAARELTTLARALASDDVPFLLELAAAAGLVAVDEISGRDVVAPSDLSPDWLQAAPALQWVDLAMAWLQSRRVAGLASQAVASGVGSATADGEPPAVPDGPAPAMRPLSDELVRPSAPMLRIEILGLLADLAPGEQATTDQVRRVLAHVSPRRASRLRDLLIEHTLAEAELLGVTVGGGLTALGRTLLEQVAAGARGDRRRIAVAAEAAIPAFVDRIIVQGDHTIVAPGPLEPELARQVRAIAAVESTGPATVYRLTDASIASAMDSGWTTEAISELLARLSLTPIPQSVEYLLADLRRRHGQVRVGAATAYLRSTDPAITAALLVAAQAQQLGLRELVPGVVVATCDPRELLDLARSAGVTVVAEGADGAVLEVGPGQAPVLVPTTGPAAGRLAASVSATARLPRGQAVAAESSAVRALRLADEAAAARVASGVSAGDSALTQGTNGSAQQSAYSPPMPTAQVLRVLDSAVRHSTPLWLGYADNVGSTSERVVDPLGIEAGLLQAFDHSTNEVRTFRITRITRVSPSQS